MTRRFCNLFVLAAGIFLAAQVPARAETDLIKSSVLESNVVYLRVGTVEKNLVKELQSAQGALAASNQIAGTVLDLRFANGDDLDSAKATADLFASKKLPLAILVNRGTSGAAVKLAAQLRAARLGLIFGSAAGPTNSNGETTALVRPDIVVATGPEDERAFMNNPYGAPEQHETNAPAATNNLLPFVDHTSEADLVRARIKDGDEDGSVPPAQKPEAQKTLIRDPVLSRAVDLIKGLAVVRTAHP